MGFAQAIPNTDGGGLNMKRTLFFLLAVAVFLGGCAGSTAESAAKAVDTSPFTLSPEIDTQGLVADCLFGETIENPALREELISALPKILDVPKTYIRGDGVPHSDEVIATVPRELKYYAVLPEFATDKESLLAYFNRFYTESYIENMVYPLEKTLFDSKPSLFIMVDNRLGVADGMVGATSYYAEETLEILQIENENTVTAALESVDVGGCRMLHNMTLIKSPEYGWRLDSSEEKSLYESQVLCSFLMANKERIDEIFAGAPAVLKNGHKTQILQNGVPYEEIERHWSVEDMKKFLREMFAPEIAEKYIERYVRRTYMEKDGHLYRAVNAPKKVLPEFAPESYKQFLWGEFCEILGAQVFSPEVSYEDPQTGEMVRQKFSIRTIQADGYRYFTQVTEMKVLSEIPLIEKT